MWLTGWLLFDFDAGRGTLTIDVSDNVNNNSSRRIGGPQGNNNNGLFPFLNRQRGNNNDRDDNNRLFPLRNSRQNGVDNGDNVDDNSLDAPQARQNFCLRNTVTFNSNFVEFMMAFLGIDQQRCVCGEPCPSVGEFISLYIYRAYV